VDQRLSAPERVDLMGNAEALSSAGRLPAASALALVDTFHADPERQVLVSAVDLASAPQSHLVTVDLMPNYRRFLLKNFQARAHELSWTPKPGESDDTRLLRPSIVREVATSGGDRAFAQEAIALTETWLTDQKAVDPNMVSAVLGTAAYYGDKTLFDRFLAAFKKSQDKQLREILVGAMGSFRDRASIEAGMQALIAGDIPFTEGAFLLFAGQGREATRKVAFEFLKAHFDQVAAKMPSGGSFEFGAVLPEVGRSFCDTQSRAELQDFFKPKIDKFIGGPRTLDQVLENIDLCIANKAAQEPSVAAFLQKY
jgi:alanyl aminopeptidase